MGRRCARQRSNQRKEPATTNWTRETKEGAVGDLTRRGRREIIIKIKITRKKRKSERIKRSARGESAAEGVNDATEGARSGHMQL